MKTRQWLGLLLFAMVPLTAVRVQGQSVDAIQIRQRLGVVIVVNGAGDDVDVTENLSQLLGERGLPLAVYTIRWCRWSLPVKDHKDYDHRLQGAHRLAHYVKNYRKAYPQEKIYLVGHSDGTHVILMAAGILPPRSVDCIILMSSMVSYNFDLRSALMCSRTGIDHFFSREDRIVVNAAEECGTADRKFVPAAGERGFAVPPPGHSDWKAYRHLRQYCWHPSQAWTGHRGGHAGCICIGYLEAFILPILVMPPRAVSNSF